MSGNAKIFAFGILSVLMVAGLFSQGGAPGSEGKVAIVCFLQGKATVRTPGQGERKDLGLFDWINSGASVETGAGARLVIAFSNGSRYEIGEDARVVVEKDGCISQNGSVKKLAAVPVMPKMVSLTADIKLGSRLGGIRLRSSKRTISNLYPNEGDAVLADQAVLSFDPLTGIEKYRVEIEDEQGRDLLSVETSIPRVVVSPGIITPGTRYYWQVRALEKNEPATVSYAAFATATDEEAEWRNSFKAQVGPSRDVANLLLLARIEMAIGLRRESCETLSEALALFPDNEKIREAMARIDCEKK